MSRREIIIGIVGGAFIKAAVVRSTRDPLGLDLRVSIPIDTPESDPGASALAAKAWRHFASGRVVNFDIPLV